MKFHKSNITITVVDTSQQQAAVIVCKTNGILLLLCFVLIMYDEIVAPEHATRAIIIMYNNVPEEMSLNYRNVNRKVNNAKKKNKKKNPLVTRQDETCRIENMVERRKSDNE